MTNDKLRRRSFQGTKYVNYSDLIEHLSLLGLDLYRRTRYSESQSILNLVEVLKSDDIYEEHPIVTSEDGTVIRLFD